MATFTKRKGGRYLAQIRRAGFKHVNKTLPTLESARRWAKATEAEMTLGTYKDDDGSKRTTLRSVIDWYAVTIVPSKKHPKKELSKLRNIRKHAIANLAMANVSPAECEEYKNFRLATRIRGNTATIRPSTVIRELMLLSHIFSTARTHPDMKMRSLENPVTDMSMPKPTAGRNRRDQGNEIETVLSHTRSIELPFIIRLGVETAMRREEVCEKLRWELIRWEDQVAHLMDVKDPAQDESNFPKPLSTRAIAILNAWKAASGRQSEFGPVFSMRPDSATTAWIRARKRAMRECASIADFRLHDATRHEGTSRLVDRGDLDLLAIAAVTNHRDLRTLKRYSHPDPKKLARRLG